MEAFLCLLRESVWLRDKKRGPFSSLLAGAEMEEDECEHMPQENPREELSQDPVLELSGGPAGGGSRYPPSHHLILPRAPRCAPGDTAGPVHR
ncbi:GTPase IMAP family member 6 isoform X5 [Macaca thibetana thibetana]|uniref:GTPase IMAP family member 6 isoform X3 n=2 Tax=Macaca fascicularis TaxID=9541 RepID=UPI0021BCBF2E|nr:GTPase IMAP family member 6 isoform X5 [Macaca thibetana thibetana]